MVLVTCVSIYFLKLSPLRGCWVPRKYCLALWWTCFPNENPLGLCWCIEVFRYHDTLLWKLLEVSTYFLRLELLTENLVRFLYIHLPSTMLQELFMIWAAVYVWFPYSAHWVLSSIPSKYLPMGMVVYTASSNLLWFSLRSVYLISPYMSIVWWTRSIILIQKDSVYLWRSFAM